MAPENERTPLKEDRQVGLENWNCCAGRNPSNNITRMCNQDTPWRSSEEESDQRGWSADEEESSSGTAGEWTNSFSIVLRGILFLFPPTLDPFLGLCCTKPNARLRR